MRKCLLAVLIALIALPVLAQTAEYTFSTEMGAYSPITGGVSLGSETSDDQRYVDPSVPLGGTVNTGPGFPIGFDFMFNGTTFDRLGINTNGWVGLGVSTITPSVNVNYSELSFPLSSTVVITPDVLYNRIAAFGRDIQAQTGASIRMETIGAAPDRICVIQWTNYKKYSNDGTGDSYNFQIRLHETTNKVSIVYGNMVNATVDAAIQVGLRGPQTSDFYTLSGATGWSNVTRGLQNNATVSITPANVPANGLTFNFAYPVAAQPPNPAILVYPANNGWTFLNGTLNWMSGGGLPTSYDLYFGTTENPPFLQNLTINSFTPTLAENTTYYWKVVPTNQFGGASNCPVWSFRTPSISQVAESFENTTFPPVGWANPGTFTRSTTTPFHLTASAYKYSSTSTAYILSMPRLTLVQGSKVDFYAHTTTANTAQRIQVVYSPDRTTWTAVGDPIALPSNGPWAPYSVDLSSLAGNNYYIGFQIPTATSTGAVYIDHVFGPEITPEAPGAVTLSTPADNATGVVEFPTFTWTAPATGGVPFGYRVYCDTNTDPTTVIGTATTLSFAALTALEFNTTYYWKVVPYNALGEATGNLVRSFTVRPNPIISTFPYTENFDNNGTSFPPPNWSRLDGLYGGTYTSGSQWIQDDWLNNTAGGNKAAKINIYGTTRYGWLITPPINIPTVGYEMKFDAAFMVWNGTTAPTGTQADDRFLVVMSDSPNMTNPTILREWNNTGSPYVLNSIPVAGQNYSIILEGISGTKYFAFYGESTVTSNGDNDLMIDNLQIRQIPTAPLFSVTPDQYNFGEVNLGGTRSKDFVITNLGIGQLGINSISIAGSPNFSLATIPPLPANVALGQTLSFTVSFSPSALTTYTATVTIVDNLGRVTHTIPISGSGVNVLTIGDGSQNERIPMDFYWKNSLFETIYNQNELDGFVGQITGVKFYNNFYTTTLTSKPTKIWLGTTTLADLSAGWIPTTELTLVFDGNVNYPGGLNEISINFPEPFMYLGGQNLVMFVHRPMDSAFFSSTDYFKAQTVGTNRSRLITSDDITFDPTAPPAPTATQLSGKFPKTTFFVIPGGVGSITGTILGAGNTPLQGVLVNVDSRPYSATTNALGEFVIPNVLPGSYTVALSKYGYQTLTQNIVVDEDENEVINVTMSLLPMVTVSGTINASDTGAAINGASISLVGYSNYTTTSSANGSFSIANVYANQTYTYSIVALGYSSNSGSINVGATNHSMGTITLSEVAYPPLSVSAELNETFSAINLNWLAPNPNALQISESFESDLFPPLDWSQSITNNGPANSVGVLPTWCRFGTVTISSSPVVPSEGAFQAGLWDDPNYAHQDEWMISPSFLCPPDVYISFDTYATMGSIHGDHYYVKASSNGGTTWDVLWDASALPIGTNFYAMPIDISLSAYSGLQTLIAFHAVDGPNNDGLWNKWFIDNVFIGNNVASQRSSYVKSTKTSSMRSNTRETRALTGYKVWRMLSGQENNESSWTLLTPDMINQTTFVDNGWNTLANGTYKWAVKAVYTAGVTSVAAFSNPKVKEVVTGTIVGFVRRNATAGIAGATVSAGGFSTTTNNGGAYMLVLPIGLYEVTATATGYQPRVVSNITVNPNQNTTLNFIMVPTSNEDELSPVTATALKGNIPNPFNPETTIRFDILEPCSVRLDVYNLKGQKVRTLVNEHRNSGRYSVVFDSRDDKGVPLASGVYFYRFSAGKFSASRKMLLME